MLMSLEFRGHSRMREIQAFFLVLTNGTFLAVCSPSCLRRHLRQVESPPLHSGKRTRQIPKWRASRQGSRLLLDTGDIYEGTKAIFTQEDRDFARRASDYLFEF